MQKRLAIVACSLLIPSATAAQAPPQPVTPATAGVTTLLTGTVDVGGLFTTTDGDRARFERYRDTRDGVFSGFRLERQHSSYLFNARASHIGYRDQQYAAVFVNRRLNVGFDWTSLPLNFSYLTRTPYTIADGVLTLDPNAQAAVQGPTNAPNDGSAVGVPCAPGAPPASCSTPALAAQAKATRSIYDSLASQFDLRYGRDIATVGVTYSATRAVDVDARFVSSGRDGLQPWGASFAFNNALEVPLPLAQRTNDLSLGVSWANPRAMLRVGWDGSWFGNDIQSLVWDNPIRVTDFNNGLLPPAGPYDASAYSNGNGAARGRMALMPSNTMNVVSATGLYKLPRRTTINGTLQLTSQVQDETLVPWTINSVINSPAVHAAFPNLQDLPRPTAEAEAQGINTVLNFSSRPFRRTGFTVRYRYNERDVQTPVFDATQQVTFDGVPQVNEHGLSHQYDTSRHNFDANVSFTPVDWGTIRVGYGHEAVERHGRGFSDVGENVFRVSLDAYTSQFFTVRASLDSGRRRGEGYVEAETGFDEDAVLFGPGGTQPTLRYFDEADRNRTRGSLVLTVMPQDVVDFFVQFSGGSDEYLPDDFAPVSRPGELFGLREFDVTSWNFGVNVHPGETVSAGASYGRDKYDAFQLSRNANPPPDPQWNDPNRDWSLDNAEGIDNFGLYVDLLRTVRNTDIRVGYDYSDSDNSFEFGGPRIAALSAIGQFIPLPDVENSWHRLSADVQYFFTTRAGVGVGYYVETFDIVDFNTIDTQGPVGFAPETGEPRLDWLGGLTTGYGNRPYTGHSVFVRALYRF